ncbi:MAG: sulfurtransferase [Gammaproteobacteria bacterium]|nr:sulfurtransferase [Gammaproteobacteria bacterium]
MKHISVSEFKNYIDEAQESPLLLDVREPWEYQLCHIDNSKLVPMNQMPNVMQELDKDRETFLICHHGVRSQRVGLLLKDCGFSKVVNVTGGISAWAQTIDPGMTTY